MSSRIKHVRCDPDLARSIDEYARAGGMSDSEALRDLLRKGLEMPADERGFAEGYLAGVRKVRQKLAADDR